MSYARPIHVFVTFLVFIFKCFFFYFLLSMFLMKPKFTIYKSSFYIYTICKIYTVNIAKELHASGGAIWPTYGLKMLFTILFLLVYLNNIPSLKVKLLN